MYTLFNTQKQTNSSITKHLPRVPLIYHKLHKSELLSEIKIYLILSRNRHFQF